uniref:Protein RRNAD1 n=1 Tax=Schistocephalus solidus TaxID=70667 RepID=A0A0X3P1X8_SCHSO
MQCGVSELDTLISSVLGFLTEYSWVYAFKWVDLLSYAGNPAGDPVLCCPAEWKIALCSAEVRDLQSVVLGNPSPATWPASLKFFARQCMSLSRRLMESSSCIPISANQPTASIGHVVAVPSAGYLAYATVSPSPNMTKHVKVKLKKQHEIEIMSAFVCDMLQDTLTAAPAVNYETRNRTFQTSEFFESPQPLTKESRSCASGRSAEPNVGGLVDLGSGLGHLPNYVMRMLSVVNPQIPRPRLVAVEADPIIHSRAKELEDKKVSPNDRILRECIRVTTDNLENLRDRFVSALLPPLRSALLRGFECGRNQSLHFRPQCP